MRQLVPIALFAIAAALANVLTTCFGFIPVGLGLTATAGTYAAGAALVARDFIHETTGWRGVTLAIAVGAGLSYLFADPFIATASVVAFTLSEIADAFVYAPLRRRRWRLAVIASSVVGAVVDTAIFLAIAFGAASVTGDVMAGQIVGKVLWVAVPVAIIGGLIRGKRSVNV